MSKKIRNITETAVMLAMLIALQALTKPLGQIVTGSCVNAVLAVTALFIGLGGGLTVALISPVCAFALGIAPNFVTVLPIMVGNACYVALLHWLAEGKQVPKWKKIGAVGAAASVKFAVLYVLVVKVICGLASGALLGKKIGGTVVLAPHMLKLLPTMFAWPQLITAVIGGAVALLIVPVLKKALKR